MNKISTCLCLLLLGLGINTAFSQEATPLYVGNRTGGTLYTVDTTGLAFTVVGSVPVTSDFGGLTGIYGLAMDPTDEQMYALYESGNDNSNRRLGTIDPETGTITDIGNAGNFTDIDFGADGTLFGTTGSPDSYSFQQIDKSTAASTFIFSHLSSSWGGTIGYDQFSDEMVYACDDAVNTIDLGTFVETGMGYDPVTECHGLVFLAPDYAWIAHYGDVYELDMSTGTETFLSSPGFNAHSMAFGPPPCEPITVDATDVALCEGEETTLTATGGGTITWDMGVMDGVPFAPGPPGTYIYTATSDDEDWCPAQIEVEVVGLPTVIAGSGDLNYCDGESVTLSAAGDADEYVWNGGEPLDLNPPVGEHTYMLEGFYVGSGCDASVTTEVTITMHPLPTIGATASEETICIGLETSVSGTGGETYMWDMGVVDGEPFSPNEIGVTTYTVTGTDEFGCMNTATVDVEVVDNISIAGTTVDAIEMDGSIDITVSGGAPAYTFDWDNDGTGDFDDDEDLTGLDPGTYTVVIMGSAGCEATATFELGSQLSITENEIENIRVYPNPTVDHITIELEGEFSYELVGINGKVLAAGNAVNLEQLDLSTFASGIYFVNVKTNTASTALKVVKK